MTACPTDGPNWLTAADVLSLTEAVEATALRPGRHCNRTADRRRSDILPVEWQERVGELQDARAGPGNDHATALRAGSESAAHRCRTSRQPCVVKVAAN